MLTHSPNSHRKPQVYRPDGRRLPARLRLLRGLFTRGPRFVRVVLEQATPRLVAPSMPDLLFGFPDGRRFHLPADPGPYAQIFTRGEFEPGESAVIRQLLRPGDVAVDVGANLGWFTLVMASAVAPAGEVWAIEPMPPILPALKRNLELNASLEIRLFELALGAEPGEVDLHVFSGLRHGHASLSTLDRSDYTAHRVVRKTMDELLAGGRTPAFVKLDVEGSELDVLRGAKETLASPRPPIWMIEVNYETSGAFGYRPSALLDPFQARGGYQTYRIAAERLIPEEEPESAPNGSNWILVPSGHRDRLA